VSNLEVTFNAVHADTNLKTIKHNQTCGAKTRAGHPCRTAAMPNGRCRMHGGNNPGAPKGNRNAWKHGGRSSEQRALRLLLRLMRRDPSVHGLRSQIEVAD
jgi:hypothetical protein